MRILVRTQLHRAFPELDQYSDEQCLRFVAAARRGWRRRIWHWPLLALAGFVAGIGTALFGMVGAWVLSWLVGGGRGTDGPFMAGWTAGAVFAGLPLFSAVYVLRDRLLRRRVRYILGARGTCANCHYNLIGLPVSAEHKVHCPECAMESSVDPALGELVTDTVGQPRYRPHESMLPPRERLTPAQRKRIFRRTAGILGTIALLIIAGFGWHEWSIRSQAARALAAKPGATGLLKFVQTAQASEIAAGGENAWDTFTAVLGSISASVAKFAVDNKDDLLDADGNAIFVDVTVLNGAPFEDERLSDSEKAQRAKAIDLAKRLLEAHRQAGVFDELDKLSDPRWAVRPVSLAPGAPLLTMLLPELGQARQIARLNGARMYLAGNARDAREFGRALRSTLGLASIIYRQPVLIDYLVGVAIEASGYARVEEVLADHPDAAMLDAIQHALDAQPRTLPRSHAFNGERVASLDSIAWTFSDPSRTRWGTLSPGLGSLVSSTNGTRPAGRLGSYDENVRRINAMFDGFALAANQPRWQRAPVVEARTGLAIIDIIAPAISHVLRSGDQLELQRAGIRTWIALERHRLAHGDYPQRLGEITPSFIPALPIDPFSGKPLLYKRVDAAIDKQGRSFLLYSVGADGQDNGGKPSLGRYDALTSPTVAGTDFILNDVRQ